MPKKYFKTCGSNAEWNEESNSFVKKSGRTPGHVTLNAESIEVSGFSPQD